MPIVCVHVGPDVIQVQVAWLCSTYKKLIEVGCGGPILELRIRSALHDLLIM